MSAVDLLIIGIGVLAGCFLLFIWGELMDEHKDMEDRE